MSVLPIPVGPGGAHIFPAKGSCHGHVLRTRRSDPGIEHAQFLWKAGRSCLQYLLWAGSGASGRNSLRSQCSPGREKLVPGKLFRTFPGRDAFAGRHASLVLGVELALAGDSTLFTTPEESVRILARDLSFANQLIDVFLKEDHALSGSGLNGRGYLVNLVFPDKI